MSDAIRTPAEALEADLSQIMQEEAADVFAAQAAEIERLRASLAAFHEVGALNADLEQIAAEEASDVIATQAGEIERLTRENAELREAAAIRALAPRIPPVPDDEALVHLIANALLDDEDVFKQARAVLAALREAGALRHE